MILILFGMVKGLLFALLVALFLFDIENDTILNGFMIAGAIMGGLGELAKFFPGDRGGRK